MFHPAIVVGLIACLFGAMLGVVEIGHRLARGRSHAGLAAVETAVFGLMGLLLAFTFGSAAVRFETRRNLIVEEANNISTAYLRLEMLPESTQPALRDAFREYGDTRLAIYRLIPDMAAAQPDRRPWDDRAATTKDCHHCNEWSS
jgi:hypothetical protein